MSDTDALKKLTSMLREQLTETNRIILSREKLNSIYHASDIEQIEFSRITSMLEKLAVITPSINQK